MALGKAKKYAITCILLESDLDSCPKRGKTFLPMKHLFLATVFAVATLTACAHKPAPAPVDAKVVKTPAKCCKKK